MKAKSVRGLVLPGVRTRESPAQQVYTRLARTILGPRGPSGWGAGGGGLAGPGSPCGLGGPKEGDKSKWLYNPCPTPNFRKQ